MTKMMNDEAYGLLDKITENDNLLQSIYLKRPFKKSTEEKESKDRLLSKLDSSTQESLPSETSQKSLKQLSKQQSKRSKSGR